MLVCALPLRAADNIRFDPRTTDAEFREFSRIVAQGIYATPVAPARATSIIGFDIGVAATGVKVDRNASYWLHSTSHDFTTHGYAAVPRLVVMKGFQAGTVSATYAKLNDSGVSMYGGALDFPIIRGTIASPELAVRAAYSQVNGISVYKQKTYGAEAFLSKGIGPVTPYIALGMQRNDAHGTIVVGSTTPQIDLRDSGNFRRITAGVRLSFFLPKIVVEATQGQVRSYSAKVSIGL